MIYAEMTLRDLASLPSNDYDGGKMTLLEATEEDENNEPLSALTCYLIETVADERMTFSDVIKKYSCREDFSENFTIDELLRFISGS